MADLAESEHRRVDAELRADEARASCARAVELAPADADSWLALGEVLGRLGESGAARLAYGAAQQHAPADWAASALGARRLPR